MIYLLGGRNFFSFKDSFEVDFRVSSQATDREIFHAGRGEHRVNAVLAVLGGNASGKTNLLKAIGFIQWLIVDSAREKPEDELPEQHFLFCKTPDQESHLFVEFEYESTYYRYEVSATKRRITTEALYEKHTKFAYLFKRKWNKGENSYDLQTKVFSESKSLFQRQNASVLSLAALTEEPLALKLRRYLRSYCGNLSQLGRTQRHDPVIENLAESGRFFMKNKKLLEWVNKRIAHFDLGVSKIVIEEVIQVEDGKRETIHFPVGVHLADGKEYPLPLIYESSGTQCLFVLLRYILPVLNSGGVAFIDEFERGVHSHVIPRLVELFYSKKHNPRKAQLFFSCHSDYILSHLEKYQVQLVEKNESGASETWRLDSIKGVRNVDNLNAKYHAGAYGGVPNF